MGDHKPVINTGEFYRSVDLIITRQSIEGSVMKAIKKVSLFHKKDYHKRFFKFIFGEEYINYFESEKMDQKKFARAHKRKNLLSCRILE